jgi:predicted PurR-regulated permease PerM
MTETKQSFLSEPLLRFTLLLLFIFLWLGGLYLASAFLIPLCIAGLLAMLMLPLSRKLEKWKVPRGLAIGLCLLLILLTFAGIALLISTQVISFANEMPSMQGQLNRKLDSVQEFIENLTQVSAQDQMVYMEGQLESLMQSTGYYLTSLLTATTSALATVAIMALYFFFFLYYRHKFKRFVLMITPREEHDKTKEIISQISEVTQKYITGVLTVVVILSVLNTIGLMVIGIRQALFFGVLAGVLNIIPFIGSFLGGFFPAIVALLTKDSLTLVFAVAIVFTVIQLVETNLLTPNIVGSKVKLNPLAAIIALMIGGAVWGIAGMIMFIPFLGILKIICDNIASLRPYGYLIGDDSDEEENDPKSKFKNWLGLRLNKNFTTNARVEHTTPETPHEKLPVDQ